MEYSYSYLYLYLLEYLFSVLSCTQYLAKFMSTCTRTYLSTVTKKTVLMSTLGVLLSTFFSNFNQIEKKSLLFIRSSLIFFKCPSSVFFQTWKKVASSIFFRCQNQNIGIFMLKMNKKRCPIMFWSNKKIYKKWPHLFWGNKNINHNICLPHLFFIKVAWETLVYFFSHILIFRKSAFYLSSFFMLVWPHWLLY